MVGTEQVDKEVRHIPASQLLDLCAILDIDHSWKTLMSAIKSDSRPDQPKYSVEHMRMVEQAGEQQKRSCSEILLEEWSTSGRVRPKYSSLLAYLVQCQLFRAADYVHYTLLQREKPLERPTNGPAALVQIPESSPPSLETEHTLVDCVSSAPQLVLSTTLPVSKLSGYPKVFRYRELKEWSGGFSKRLGRGAFGSVYLCNLPESGGQVAVKCLRLESAALPSSQLPDQFRNELNTLSMFKHENVLSLVGYCYDGPELCLVYDYMSNGSLQDKIKEGSEDLEWTVRLDISVGVTRGIHYLHTLTDKPHIHRDIKSANILLDCNLTPKLGDFGLARPAPMSTIATTTIVGTTAYMSPEALRGDISIKMDIFSFGVVLLELVTGLVAWDENRESRSLVSYIDDIENIVSVIDRRPQRRDDELALSLYNISQQCLHHRKQNRPHIHQVLNLLLALNPHSISPLKHQFPPSLENLSHSSSNLFSGGENLPLSYSTHI